MQIIEKIKKLTFKNNAPLGSCISKIINKLIDNAKDPDIVMSMYNLIEYSDIYSMTSGSLWNYYRDEVNYNANENNADNYRINNSKTITSRSFEYKAKLIGSTPNTLNAEVVVQLKYLRNFWRFLDLPLFNCEIELDLSWSKECIISETYKTPKVPANPMANPPNPLIQATATTGATFQINNAKFYFPVVTLSINDNVKFLENIKQGFKRTISWNKYRSEITRQTKNNSLDYLIDPKFRNINRLFVFLFKNGNDDPTTNSFDNDYVPSVEIKYFNALIDNKSFFDQPVKHKQEAYEKLIQMSRNNDYTTENLLDYLYHQNYY